MRDWTPLRVEGHADRVSYEKQRNLDKASAAPWQKMKPRESDPELRRNAEQMSRVTNAESFIPVAHDSVTAIAEGLNANEEVPRPEPLDNDGWPLPWSKHTGGAFCFKDWDESEDPRVLDTLRSPEEIAKSRKAYLAHQAVNQVDPELLEDCRAVRTGEKRPDDKCFKKYDLHAIGNAIRRGSTSMQASLAHCLRERLNAEKHELETVEQASVPSGIRPDAKTRARRLRIRQVDKAILECKQVKANAISFQEQDYVDPMYTQRIASGWTKYDARAELKQRINSGLQNLSKQMARGEALLERLSKAYEEDEELPELEVEWSDADADELVEDDVDLCDEQKTWKPSRAFEQWHMEQLDDARRNEELQRNEETKARVSKHGGTFSKMDGRYHPSEKQIEKARNDHLTRTENRRLCKYFFKKKGCRAGFDCTLRHDRTEDDKQSTSANADKRKFDCTQEEERMYTEHFNSGASSSSKRRRFE